MSLTLREIHKSYGSTEVLRGISLEAKYGEVLAIVGANGAGKSTLIRILAGAIPKDSGELLLDGEVQEFKGPRDAIQQGVCTVYQELSLVPELNVTENLLMGVLPKRRGLIDWRAAHKRASEILAEGGFSSIETTKRTRDLSIAKQQMVEIAKALVTNPRILVLDEPSAVLSGADLESLYTLVHRLREKGTLVLYVSHRLKEVLTLADRILVMKDGLFVGELDPAVATEDDMITLMAGRKIDAVYPDRRSQFGDTTLELQGYTREGEFQDIHLRLRAGEILSMFGLVGSGRSELVESIFGARKLHSGSLYLHGKVMHFKSPAEAIRNGLALVTENRQHTGLILGHTVCDNINLATMHGLMLSLAGRRRNTEQMIHQLSINPTHSRRMAVSQLSGGNQQKVVLSKWLLSKPSILILDEPTRGVDMATRVDIYRMMNDLAEAGISILMVSSDLTEAVSMADRVMVMRFGRAVAELEAADTTEDKVLSLAMGGRNE